MKRTLKLRDKDSIAPHLAMLLEFISKVRRCSAEFIDTDDLVRQSGFSVERLSTLTLQFYHLNPLDILSQAKIHKACLELRAHSEETNRDGTSFGFQCHSDFQIQFRRLTGILPATYQNLGKSPRFCIALPPGFRSEYLLRALGRDPLSVIERVSGNRIYKALHIDGLAVVLEMELCGLEAICTIKCDEAFPENVVFRAHSIVLRLLGMKQNPDAFERKSDSESTHSRLIENRRGLRIPLTSDLFEALTWAIVGQQISLPFAFTLRRRLAEKYGMVVGNGLHAHPTPLRVSQLDYCDLTKLQFSQRKAEYLIDSARAIVNGDLPLDEFTNAPVPVTEKRLLAVRGLGPWSVNYLMLRGYGFADCVPVGDSGLRAALKRYFDLEKGPSDDEVVELMKPFSPFRSLATFHLWITLGEPI